MSKFVCRICIFFVDNPAKYLFCGSEESKEILRKIFFCAQVRISNEQKFSFVLCNNCLSELNIAYNFRLKCLASEDKLGELLQQKSAFDDLGIIENNPNNLMDHSDSESDSNKASKEEAYECNVCKKVLKTQSSLEKHKESMHIKKNHFGKVTGFGMNRLYHCTECNYSSPHSQTLVNHTRIHSGERPFECHCGKSFRQPASLIAHRKTHSKETCCICFTCGKQFKHLYSLKTHYKVHQDPAFKCSICGKKLKNKATLESHMNRHNNIRNYNCEECGDTFCSASGLFNHKKKHNKKEENMQCHLCGYKTHWKKVLTIHMKRHTGERPFKCDQCDQCCYTKSELTVHQRKHTREKRYGCPRCSQHFAFSSSLNKHMRNIHHSNYKWGQNKRRHPTKLAKDVIKQEIAAE